MLDGISWENNMEYTKIVDDIPEEGDIVEFKTWNGEVCIGFYTLPYRAYPNSFFDPFKLARWCEVDFEGSWHPTNKKPTSWRLLAKHGSNDEKNLLCGSYYNTHPTWFPKYN